MTYHELISKQSAERAELAAQQRQERIDLNATHLEELRAYSAATEEDREARLEERRAARKAARQAREREVIRQHVFGQGSGQGKPPAGGAAPAPAYTDYASIMQAAIDRQNAARKAARRAAEGPGPEDSGL